MIPVLYNNSLEHIFNAISFTAENSGNFDDYISVHFTFRKLEYISLRNSFAYKHKKRGQDVLYYVSWHVGSVFRAVISTTSSLCSFLRVFRFGQQ